MTKPKARRRVANAWHSFRDFMDSPTENSVVRFAWAIVAIALIGLNWYAINTLAARDWCAQIMTTEKYLGPDGRLSSAENIKLIVELCGETGKMQIEAIAWVAKALAVALGLIPVAVFVVKFSGAGVSGTVAGASARLGAGDSALRQAAHDAAETVADKSREAAQTFPEPDMPPADDERI